VRYLAHLIVSIIAGLFALVATFLIAFWMQVAIYGKQAFEHDAGASFAVVVRAAPIAVIVGIAIFAVVFEILRERESNRAARMKGQPQN
jgi:hypothetical protein